MSRRDNPLPSGERVRGRETNSSETEVKRKNVAKCRKLRKNQTDAERKL
jgi:hypothetical protein